MPATRACASSDTPGPTRVTGAPAATSPTSSTASAFIETTPTTRARCTVDEHFCAGEVAPEPIAVPDRDDADPRVPLGDEAAAVAGRLTGVEELHLRNLAPPRQHRREPIVLGLGAEGRQSVDGDPAARRVEPRLRQTERCCAVRHVSKHGRGKGLGRDAEALDLTAREVEIGVRGGEMRHHAGDPACRRGQLAQPPAAHAGIELQVHLDVIRNAAVGNRQRKSGLPRARHLRRRSRAEHEDARPGEDGPELDALCDRRNAQRGRSGGESRAAAVDRSVPVTVVLDDDPQVSAVEHAQKPTHVLLQRGQIDRHLAAHSAYRAASGAR